METAIRGVDGRALGKKAQGTRSSLLEAFKELLNQYPAHNLHVRDLTDLANVSPAAFWQYFAHLDDAFRALADEADESNELWARQALHVVGVLNEVRGN